MRIIRREKGVVHVQFANGDAIRPGGPFAIEPLRGGNAEDGGAFGMDGVDHPMERFRMLNGLDAHAQVKVRDRVKIVVD